MNIKFYFLREALTELAFALWQHERFEKYHQMYNVYNSVQLSKAATMCRNLDGTLKIALVYLIVSQ